jgi:hypothetical protein
MQEDSGTMDLFLQLSSSLIGIPQPGGKNNKLVCFEMLETDTSTDSREASSMTQSKSGISNTGEIGTILQLALPESS